MGPQIARTWARNRFHRQASSPQGRLFLYLFTFASSMAVSNRLHFLQLQAFHQDSVSPRSLSCRQIISSIIIANCPRQCRRVGIALIAFDCLMVTT